MGGYQIIPKFKFNNICLLPKNDLETEKNKKALSFEKHHVEVQAKFDIIQPDTQICAITIFN